MMAEDIGKLNNSVIRAKGKTKTREEEVFNIVTCSRV